MVGYTGNLLVVEDGEAWPESLQNELYEGHAVKSLPREAGGHGLGTRRAYSCKQSVFSGEGASPHSSVHRPSFPSVEYKFLFARVVSTVVRIS